ncbi:hypothetical protein [Motiliproteus sediminis]|uniref:hypothetical protein n=1 Tax=Motiliproteus sediminis TaxID=1468178 RepID=UPI001AEF4122|nr:hypothetical protein [Motiliproteus sediminis]
MLTGIHLLLNWALLVIIKRPVDNETAPHAGVHARRYDRKKRVVRGLWFASGLMMLAFPITQFVVTLGLFTTFLSFTILDETL